MFNANPNAIMAQIFRKLCSPRSWIFSRERKGFQKTNKSDSSQVKSVPFQVIVTLSRFKSGKYCSLVEEKII